MIRLVDGQEYGQVKGKHGGYGNEGRTRVGRWDQRPKRRGGLCDAFLLLRDNAECFSLLFSMGDRQSDGETWVEESGYER